MRPNWNRSDLDQLVHTYMYVTECSDDKHGGTHWSDVDSTPLGKILNGITGLSPCVTIFHCNR